MSSFVPVDEIGAYNMNKWDGIKTRMRPSIDQRRHLIAFGIMLVVITIMYQISATRMLLYPFELISTVFHEFGHAFMTLLTGGRVANIEINPNESGVTRFVGGSRCLILPAGYIGSSVAGALLLVLSFGERSAKGAAIGTGVVLVATVYWAGTIFTALSTVFMIVAMLAVYLIGKKNPQSLKLIILFMGVMGSLVSLLSIFSHLITNTIDGSDAVQFAIHCSFLVPSFVYGLLWMIFSTALIIGSLLLGIYLYK